MIDERRALVRCLREHFFADGSNNFLCSRILLEEIKLDLAASIPFDQFVEKKEEEENHFICFVSF